jgi:hypothetical protein
MEAHPTDVEVQEWGCLAISLLSLSPGDRNSGVLARALAAAGRAVEVLAQVSAVPALSEPNASDPPP